MDGRSLYGTSLLQGPNSTFLAHMQNSIPVNFAYFDVLSCFQNAASILPLEFIIHNTSMTWNEASRACNKNGGRLISIHKREDIQSKGLVQTLLQYGEMWTSGKMADLGWQWHTTMHGKGIHNFSIAAHISIHSNSHSYRLGCRRKEGTKDYLWN